jgi:hypothetical protein
MTLLSLPTTLTMKSIWRTTRSDRPSLSSKTESTRSNRMRTGKRISLMSGTRWQRPRCNKLKPDQRPSHRDPLSRDLSTPTSLEPVMRRDNPSKAEWPQRRRLRLKRGKIGNPLDPEKAENRPPKTVLQPGLQMRYSRTMPS